MTRVLVRDGKGGDKGDTGEGHAKMEEVGK